MKKYEFTDETVNAENGAVLHRIKALIDIGNYVKAGDRGGFIEKEENLSHEGNAWVSGNAEVYGDAWVYDNARVYGNAWVYGNAQVYGDAKVYGGAWVYGNALVCGNARVYGDAQVYGEAWIYDDAQVCGNAKVYDDTLVYDDAKIFDNTVACYGAANAESNLSKTYYLLHLEKWIVPDWSGTVFTSMLYESRDACRKGCQTKELMEFATAILGNLDARSDDQTLEEKDIFALNADTDEFRERYEKEEKQVVAFADDVKKWLGKSRCEDSLLGDDSLFWEIIELQLAN